MEYKWAAGSNGIWPAGTQIKWQGCCPSTRGAAPHCTALLKAVTSKPDLHETALLQQHLSWEGCRGCGGEGKALRCIRSPLVLAALMGSLQIVFGWFRVFVSCAWLICCLGGCRPISSILVQKIEKLVVESVDIYSRKYRCEQVHFFFISAFSAKLMDPPRSLIPAPDIKEWSVMLVPVESLLCTKGTETWGMASALPSPSSWDSSCPPLSLNISYITQMAMGCNVNVFLHQKTSENCFSGLAPAQHHSKFMMCDKMG